MKIYPCRLREAVVARQFRERGDIHLAESGAVDQGDIISRLGERRIQLQCTAVLCDGVGKTAQRLQADTTIEMRLGALIVEYKRTLDMLERLVVTVHLGKAIADQRMGTCLARTGRDYRAIVLLRSSEIAPVAGQRGESEQCAL